jgi:hypothetical protein
MERYERLIAFSRTFCSQVKKTKEHKDSSMQGEQGYLPVIRFQPLLHLIQNEKITHRLGTKDVCSISTLVLPLYTLIHGDGISTILPFEGCNL